MNMRTIENKVKSFAVECFGMELDIPIVLNGRLTRALGQVRFRKTSNETIPYQLELAKRLFQHYDEATIDGVIKHELCHWALCRQGKPHSDGDPVFEKELKRIGAPSTMVIKYQGKLHYCVCEGCQKEVVSRRTKGGLNKYITGRYSTKCCKANIVYKGERMAN